MQTVRARRVTLSAGAINSPAILLRSGIGPRPELAALGIKAVADLPGVGRNLIDHLLVAVMATPVAGVAHDPRVTNPVGIRYTANGSSEFNDMQMHIFTYFDEATIAGSPMSMPPCPSVSLVPGLQRPRARGRVSLRSADPNIPPEIDLNYLGDPEDMRRMVDGVRIAWRLMNSTRLRPYLREFLDVSPAIIDSDSAVADYVRKNCGTIFHPVSNTKMGLASDEEAVVDEYCRLHGIEGLRVVDASVMPNIVRANTNLTCIMIGERVADWMRAEV